MYRVVVSKTGEEPITSVEATMTLMSNTFIISGVTYMVIDEQNRYVSVVDFDGSSSSPVVPKNPVHPTTSIMYTVTEIGEEAFMNKSITSIALPSTVTYIRARAFKGCTSLATMTQSD